MSTTPLTTAQLAASLSGDPQIEKLVETETRRSRIVSHLLSLRVRKGLTQEDIAKAMQCDASRISRLESGNDLGLKWVDIVGYARALNMSISLMFDDPNMPAAENIKRCVFRIRKDLDKLTELAKESGRDESIARKIHEFSGEVLFNFLLQYMDHAEELDAVIKVSNRASPAVDCAANAPEIPSPQDKVVELAAAEQ